MFFWSLKLNKSKTAVLLMAVVFGVVIGTLAFSDREARAASVVAAKPVIVNFKAGDNELRKEFLAQFGWKTDDEPSQIMEMRIPGEFDEVYENYQALQRSQGFDLERYKNKKVKRYSYRVTNYPGGEEQTVYANILIYEGVVIGGDISSVALDGFMHGFSGEMPDTKT